MSGSSRRKLGIHKLSSTPVSTEECQGASLILQRTYDSVSALLGAFDDKRVRPGRPSDEDQDLLRAMLVMAAAGVDAVAKQLIRDCLPVLAQGDPVVKKGLEGFIARQLGDDKDPLGTSSGRSFLGRVLASASHQHRVIEEYIEDLTGGSLQSVSELFRTAVALGVKPSDLGLDKNKLALQTIFADRNKIIHELDIRGFAPGQRVRNPRSKNEMIGSANTLLRTAEALRDAVDKKLVASPPADPWQRFLRTTDRPFPLLFS